MIYTANIFVSFSAILVTNQAANKSSMANYVFLMQFQNESMVSSLSCFYLFLLI